MVNSAGIITTLAGGFPGYNGEDIPSTLAAMGGPVALAADGQGNIYVVEASTQRIRKLSTSCGPAALSAGGEAFSHQGGTGSITITTGANCPWSVGPLPPWVALTSPSSGVGNGTLTFQVSHNNGSGLSGSFEIAGDTFSVEQSAASIPGLAAIGSMAQIASAGGWKMTITLINTGAAAAQVRLNFFDNSGSPLLLPLAFPQGSASTANGGPLLASTLDRTLSGGASLIIETTGPDAQAMQVGWAQLLSTGSVADSPRSP